MQIALWVMIFSMAIFISLSVYICFICCTDFYPIKTLEVAVISSFCFSIKAIILFSEPLMRFGSVACLSSESNLAPVAGKVAI